MPEEQKLWATEFTRTFVGGEFHSVFFVDLKNKSFYGQGISKTYIITGTAIPYHIKFKKINPQNRSHYFIAKICDGLFVN
ncbi:MAG: hypothetical protein JXA68_07485 [Ignavibacteriales bacterium]|nr:hypothetical protein [Ignavibacteriales bacterium]